jgi:hypothetical protein
MGIDKGTLDKRQIFLGGACGQTTWRRDIAIPLLETAGITYFDPQIGIGEWNEEYEKVEMAYKLAADVQLFVISGETRGVAAIAEVAYLIAAGRPLALSVVDVPTGASFDAGPITDRQRDDLNRGRIFIRTMARQHNIPVFTDVHAAVEHAITLVRTTRSLDEIRAILANVECKEYRFLVEFTPGGFHLQIETEEADITTGQKMPMYGRKWFIPLSANRSDIVRTAFKASLTWEEHELREHFLYRAQRVFGPHIDLDKLANLGEDSHDR